MAKKNSEDVTETLQDVAFLSRKTSYLYLSDELSDLSLWAMGQDGTWKKLPAHRLILAACSLYWKALLQSQFKVATESEIKVEHANEDVMKEVLRFVYTGTVELSVANVASVMSAAVQEQIDGLLVLCKTYVSKNINFNLCCSVFNIKCIDGELDDIKKQCKEFIQKRGEDFTKNSESFLKNVEEAMLIDLITSTDFKAEEHCIFNMVQLWCEAHAQHKTNKKELSELYAPFECLIRYPQLHPRHIQTLVRASGLVREELLLDAWEARHGLRTDSHADWTQPRLETLTWHVPLSEVKKSAAYFDAEQQMYKQHQFYIKLYPGTRNDGELYLSCFFGIKEMSTISEGHGLNVSWKITLKNQMDPDRNISRELHYVFETPISWGYSKFIELEQLEESDGRQSEFLDKGFMTFEVRILDTDMIKLPVKTS